MPSAPAALAASMSASITSISSARIEEVAAARADDDMQPDALDLPAPADHPEARRRAALDQAGAKLDPVGAGLARRDHPGDRIDADLEAAARRTCRSFMSWFPSR